MSGKAIREARAALGGGPRSEHFAPEQAFLDGVIRSPIHIVFKGGLEQEEENGINHERTLEGGALTE